MVSRYWAVSFIDMTGEYRRLRLWEIEGYTRQDAEDYRKCLSIAGLQVLEKIDYGCAEY